MMKKFLISFLKFVLFAGIFYLVFIIIWGEFSPVKKNLRYRLKPDGHTFSRLKELRETKDVDILFLGSSHTYRGFDNRVFDAEGYKTFNMGSNSQTPIQTEYLLENYLDSLDPKLVIYEVCPFVFNLDGVESSMEIIANDDLNKYTLSMVLKQNHLKVYNAYLYTTYRRLFFDDLENTKESVKNNNDTYIKGGFVDISMFYYEKEHFAPQQWEQNAKQIESFENILSMLRKRNIKLLLVQAPVTSDLYNSYGNNDDFDHAMKEYGAYHNFNKTLTLTDTVHFFDFHHLNRKGIEIFNKEIVNLIDEQGDLK